MTYTNEGFVKPTVVKAFIEGRTAKGQFATITFKKKDGTIREINGCFAPSSKIVGSEKGFVQSEQMKARGQIPIYSVKDKHWKSFYLNQVVEIA